jgi:hypothetical protein
VVVYIVVTYLAGENRKGKVRRASGEVRGKVRGDEMR